MFTRGFLGVLPTKLVATIGRICRPQEWNEVFTACSGTFRIERGLRCIDPAIKLHSNDVSLFSTAIGRNAINDPLPYTFTGQLAFVEELGLDDPRDRIAAINVALSYASFVKSKNPTRFNITRAEHMKHGFRGYVAEARKGLDKLLDQISIQSYFAGDFRDHIEHAIERKAGVLAFPPTFRGGYEKMFEFVHANVEWDPPSYRMYDPENETGQVLERLKSSGIPFFLYVDHPVDGHTAQVMLEAKGARPVYGYANAQSGTSYQRAKTQGKQFAYKSLDLMKLTKKSKVTVVPCAEGT